MKRIRVSTRLNELVWILSIEGEVAAEAIQAAVRGHLASATAKCLLLDFSKGAVAFRNDEGGRSIQPSHQGGSSGRPAPKTALVCPNELDYGLFRILQVFSPMQSYPHDLRVFRQAKPAWRWLEVCRWCRKTRQTMACRSREWCIS